MTSNKVLERALDEIERLKLEINKLRPKKEPVKAPSWAQESKESRLDKILKGRDAAMERFSNKLFGGNNAKQK